MKPNTSRSRATEEFSMDDFEKALQGFDYEFQRGQIVQGKVVSHAPEGVYVDIGAKSLAFVPTQEVSLRGVKDLSAVLPEEETAEFLIVREPDGDGQVTLSLKQLEIRRTWDRLAEMQESRQSLTVRVTGTNKGGVTVDVQGVRGFIPRSHLIERDNLEALVRTSLTATILELNQEKGKLVLSNRLASRSEVFSQLEVGQLVEGKISGLKPFGVFVDLDGTSGLLHINQISQKYVESLASVFQVGQPVKAMIVNLDADQGRISLSTKVLENYPGEMLDNPATVFEEATNREPRARKTVMGA